MGCRMDAIPMKSTLSQIIDSTQAYLLHYLPIKRSISIDIQLAEIYNHYCIKKIVTIIIIKGIERRRKYGIQKACCLGAKYCTDG